MSLSCPNCRSQRITTRNAARKVCGSAGAAIGATGAGLSVVGGARLGAAAGSLLGPAGTAMGGIAGALAAIAAGAIAGGTAGAALGETLDGTILDNCECQECGHTFSREMD